VLLRYIRTLLACFFQDLQPCIIRGSERKCHFCPQKWCIHHLVTVLITDPRNQTYGTGVSFIGVVFVWNFMTIGQVLQTVTCPESSMNNVVWSGWIIVYRWETPLSNDHTQTLLPVHLILGGLKSCLASASSAPRLPGGERSCSQNRSMYRLLLVGTQN